MHRLVTVVGWPALIVCVLIAAGAVPTLLCWVRFEIQLARRTRRYEARSEAARASRAGW